MNKDYTNFPLGKGSKKKEMTAATHLMFAKDQRGGLRSPPRPQGTPPTPILEKTLVSRNDF